MMRFWPPKNGAVAKAAEVLIVFFLLGWWLSTGGGAEAFLFMLFYLVRDIWREQEAEEQRGEFLALRESLGEIKADLKRMQSGVYVCRATLPVKINGKRTELTGWTVIRQKSAVDGFVTLKAEVSATFCRSCGRVVTNPTAHKCDDAVPVLEA